MPAAKSKTPSPDAPLRRLRPTGGWIEREPTEYTVRAQHAEEALTLALYCHAVHQGKIPAKYAGRVAHSVAELSELPGLRTFSVWIGSKCDDDRKVLATEILEVTDAA